MALTSGFLFIYAPGVLGLTGLCVAIAVVTSRQRMGPWERLLRWYTGRQILQPHRTPTAAWYPLLPTGLKEPAMDAGQSLPSTDWQIRDLLSHSEECQADPAQAAQIIAAFQRGEWPWAK